MSIKLKDTIYDLINNSNKLDGKDSNYFASLSSLNEYLPLSGGILSGNLSLGDTKTTTQFLLSVSRGNIKSSLLISGAKEGWYLTSYEDGNSTALIQNETSGLVYKNTSGTYYTVLHAGNYSSYAATKDHTHSQYLTELPSHSHSYLPLSGGTISGRIYFTNSNYYTQYYASGKYYEMYNAVGKNGIAFFDDGSVIFNVSGTSRTIWHTGNFTPSNYLPLTGGTLTGALTISTSSTTQLTTISSMTTGWITGVNITAPSMGSGSHVNIAFGKTSTAKNRAWVGYYHSSDGSNDNRLCMGLHNVDDVFNITGAANVGIGTTSPSYKLEVNGNGRFNKYLVIGASLSQPNTARAQLDLVSSDANPCDLNLGADSTRYWSITARNNADTIFGSKGLGFWDSVNSVYRMCITQSGNVGIGITSPSAKLEVAGDVIIQDNISVLENSGHFSGINFWYGNKTRNYHLSARGGETNKNFRLYWYNGTNYNPLIDVTESGNVGIGTTSPAYKLEVNGDIKFLNKLVWADTTNYYIGARSNNAFDYVNWYGHYFKSAGTDRMCITRDGLVGIGTTSPAHALDVNGNIGCGHIYHSDGITYITMGVSGTTRYVNVGQYNNSTYSTYLNLNASLATRWISAAGSEIVRIDHSNGNIGIGTTSPSYKLHVNGNAKIVNALWLDDAILFGSQHQIKKDTSGIFMYNSVATSFIELYDNKNITLSTGANEANVNISTTADKITSLNFLNSNVINWQISSRTSSQDKGLRIYSYDGTSWLATMTILKSGNVGIDTTSPAYKLDVNGSFNCSTFYIGNDQITFIT